jgi:hypothetical protein
MGVMRDGHARRVPLVRALSAARLVGEHPSGRYRQAQAAEDHDTYAKAQVCAHFQPEGQ